MRDPKVDLQQPSVHWTFVRSHSLIACALGWGGPWNPSIAANGSPCKYVLCVRIIISRLLRNVLANHQPFRTQLEMENKAIFFKPKKKHLHHGVFIKEDLYFFFRGILIVLSPYIFLLRASPTNSPELAWFLAQMPSPNPQSHNHPHMKLSTLRGSYSNSPHPASYCSNFNQ